jgi:hypothetical protein
MCASIAGPPTGAARSRSVHHFAPAECLARFRCPRPAASLRASIFAAILETQVIQYILTHLCLQALAP